MKIISSLLTFLFFPLLLLAQTEKFDIATYTPLKGWAKTKKQGVIIYSKADTATGGFCIIALYAATNSAGSPQKDFETEWKELAVTPFNAVANPATETQTTPDGWKAIAGASPVKQDNADSYIVLTVYSGFGKTTSVMATLNDQSFIPELEKFLLGIKLDKKAVIAKPQPTNNTTTTNTIISGKWGKSSGSPSAYVNGVINNLAYSGYTKGQYDFKTNGTYTFRGESWGGYSNSTEYRLIDENGSYTLNGNQLTLTPAKSIYRVVDKTGSLKKSQSIPLTKRSYAWQTHYFEGIQEMNLVLTASKENTIDGGFSSMDLFPNSFLYGKEKLLEFKFLPLK